jgi:hypothetical protein
MTRRDWLRDRKRIQNLERRMVYLKQQIPEMRDKGRHNAVSFAEAELSALNWAIPILKRSLYEIYGVSYDGVYERT